MSFTRSPANGPRRRTAVHLREVLAALGERPGRTAWAIPTSRGPGVPDPPRPPSRALNHRRSTHGERPLLGPPIRRVLRPRPPRTQSPFRHTDGYPRPPCVAPETTVLTVDDPAAAAPRALGASWVPGGRREDGPTAVRTCIANGHRATPCGIPASDGPQSHHLEGRGALGARSARSDRRRWHTAFRPYVPSVRTSPIYCLSSLWKLAISGRPSPAAPGKRRAVPRPLQDDDHGVRRTPVTEACAAAECARGS